MSRAVLTFAAAFAATVTLAATPALASTPAHAAAQPASDCDWITNNGYDLGTIICEYGVLYVGLPNDTAEMFAVGTSHAVWTAWQASPGGAWDTKSLGGSAYSYLWLVQQSGWNMTIAYSSSSGQNTCINRGNTASSGWGSWFKC
jgi:hypothetical protein